MTERHVHDDPPTTAQLNAMNHDITTAVARALSYVGTGATTLVGVAGAVTTVAGIALELDSYDVARIHHSVISADAIENVTEQLYTMKHIQRAAISVCTPAASTSSSAARSSSAKSCGKPATSTSPYPNTTSSTASQARSHRTDIGNLSAASSARSTQPSKPTSASASNRTTQ